MRPKVVLFFALIAVLALAAAVSYKKRSAVRSSNVAAAPVTNVSPAPAVVARPSPVPARTVLTPEERETMIRQETDRLAVLAMNSDPQSLSNILGDLTSPEKEIRMAAIDAAKQFDSTNAIPILRAMAADTQDPEEASAMLEAVEFLSLPDANLTGGGGGAMPSTAPAPVPAMDATNDSPPPQP